MNISEYIRETYTPVVEFVSFPVQYVNSSGKLIKTTASLFTTTTINPAWHGVKYAKLAEITDMYYIIEMPLSILITKPDGTRSTTNHLGVSKEYFDKFCKIVQ